MTLREFIESLQILEKSFTQPDAVYVKILSNKVIEVYSPGLLCNLSKEDYNKVKSFGWNYSSYNSWEYHD